MPCDKPPDSLHRGHGSRPNVVASRDATNLLGGPVKTAFQWMLIAGALTLGTAAAAEADLSEGQKIFRFDTFGDEQLWTDKLGLHKVVEEKVDPTTALKVGLKVDAEALPPGILEKADLKDPEDHRRAAQAERRGGPQGRGRREQSDHAARRHLRAVSFDRGRLGEARHRQAPGRLAEPRPRRGQDHLALAGAHRGAEEGLHLVGPGQVRPALQPGRQEHAAGAFRPRMDSRTSRTRRTRPRDRSPTGTRTWPSRRWAGRATSRTSGSRSTSSTHRTW